MEYQDQSGATRPVRLVGMGKEPGEIELGAIRDIKNLGLLQPTPKT